MGHDEHRRTEDAAKTAKLLQSIHDLRERIYEIRWDPSKSFGEKKTSIFNMNSDLLKLERELELLIRDSVKAFEMRLALEGLGLKRIHTADNTGVMRESGTGKLY